MRPSFAKRLATVTVGVVCAACNSSRPADPRMVSEWERTLYGVVRAERLSPPVASRVFTYAATALYTGVTVADRNARSLAGMLNGLDSLPHGNAGVSYDPTITSVVAERTVLDSLFGEGLPTTRSALSR